MAEIEGKEAVGKVLTHERWKNKWFAAEEIDTQRNGKTIGEFWGSDEFPTKADAEESARLDLAEQVFYAIDRGVIYLGAFPISAPESTP